MFYYDSLLVGGGGWEISARTLSDAGTLGPITVLSSGSVVEPISSSSFFQPVSAARLANGNLVVVWQSAEAFNQVYVRVFDRALNPVTTAIPVGTGGIKNTRPDVAALENGGFAVIYERELTPGDLDLGLRILDSSGGSVAAVGFASLPNIPSSQVYDQTPSIAGLVGGGMAVAWERQWSGGSAIYHAIINDGGTYRLAGAAIDGFTAGNADPEIVALRDGGYAVLYQSQYTNASTAPDIRIARFQSSGAVFWRGSAAGTRSYPDRCRGGSFA